MTKETNMTDRNRIPTDVYPTRYAAFDNPGTWAIFTPIEGKYRPCREDATPLPVTVLGAGRTYAGVVAVLHVPQGDDLPWRGVSVEVLQYPPKDRREGAEFVADCYATLEGLSDMPDPDNGGRVPSNTSARFKADTLDEAIASAEEWIANLDRSC